MMQFVVVLAAPRRTSWRTLPWSTGPRQTHAPLLFSGCCIGDAATVSRLTIVDIVLAMPFVLIGTCLYVVSVDACAHVTKWDRTRRQGTARDGM